MRPAKRWVYGKTPDEDHYEDVLVYDDSQCYSGDMDAIVACAQCGKHLSYGRTYTSREVHDISGTGFGYAVCGECYGHENERRYEANLRAAASGR